MNAILKAVLCVAPLLQVAIPDRPRPQLTILLLDGTNGRPVQNARLVVFAGATPEEVKEHRHVFDLHTDSRGVAAIPAGQMWFASLTIFVDFMTQCEQYSSARALSLPLAMSQGLIAGNSCGSVRIQPTPGQLVIFARKPTIRERMAW